MRCGIGKIYVTLCIKKAENNLHCPTPILDQSCFILQTSLELKSTKYKCFSEMIFQ